MKRKDIVKKMGLLWKKKTEKAKSFYVKAY
jgi:hypothetical protein